MEKIWLKSYPGGVPSEADLGTYSSLVDLFLRNCEKFKDRPALNNLGSQMTFQQLGELSQRCAGYFQQVLKLKKGDRIAIMLPNVFQYPICMFGALLAGLTVVNVNPLYTVPELVHQLNDAGAETIITLANFAAVVQKALPQTRLKNIIISEVGDLFFWPKALAVNWIVHRIKKKVPPYTIPQAITLKQMLAQAKTVTFTPVEVGAEDIAFLQYTGGTTGIAKAAVLTHYNLVANVEQIAAYVSPFLVEGQEIAVTPLPLYHVFSLTANCFLFVRFGALNYLITNPRDIPSMLHTLAKVPFTVITGVNTLFNAMMNSPDFNKLNLRHLKIALGGGTAVQHAVAQRWRQMTGKPLLEGYGLTEASPVICADPLDLAVQNDSAGLPLPSTEIAICDDDEQEVPLGEVGELYVKGPQVMREYWQNPEETKKVFSANGWLKTGDMARMDREGFIYIVDRKKELILVSGFKVYPNEVEDVLASHVGVQEVAVVSIPDAASGEAVKAFVVKKDPTLTEEVLKAYCHDHLTGYKRPKYFEFRDSLPKTSVGKVLRRALQ